MIIMGLVYNLGNSDLALEGRSSMKLWHQTNVIELPRQGDV